VGTFSIRLIKSDYVRTRFSAGAVVLGRGGVGPDEAVVALDGSETGGGECTEPGLSEREARTMSASG